MASRADIVKITSGLHPYFQKLAYYVYDHELLAYSGPKMVKINDPRLGILYYGEIKV